MRKIRALLPIAGALFVAPFLLPVPAFVDFITVPLCYFLGSSCVIANFPQAVDALHARPLLVEDLDQNPAAPVRRAYHWIMSTILALLFAGFSEYFLIQGGLRGKPLIEIFAVVGGNLALYMRAQHTGGRVALFLCYCCNRFSKKIRSSRKRKLSDTEPDLELGQDLGGNMDRENV